MTATRRRFALAAAALVGAPLALALLGIAAVVVASMLGLTLDASRWRDSVAQQASAASGRTVLLQGPLQLRLGREWSLRVGGVRIMSPPGFSGQALISIGEARARIDVFDVLRGQWRLRGVDASDIGLSLERDAAGLGNWAMAPQGDAGAPQTDVDLGQIKLQDLAIRYHDARTGVRRELQLDEVSGSGGRSQALRLALRGRIDGLAAYSVKLDGGPLSHFQPDAEPWPFTLHLRTQGARLQASGAVDVQRARAQFHVDADTEDLARIARIAGMSLPPVGAASLQGRITAAANAIEISQLQGRLGESEIDGQLALALDDARPRLSGTLNAATVDLRPFLAGDGGREPRQPEAAPPDALALRQLLPIDADVALKVQRWLGVPADIRDAHFALHADARGVRLPISATLAHNPIAGGLELDTAAPTPTFALQLSAHNVSVDALAQQQVAAQGLAGTLGRIELRIAGRGETLASLLRDLQLSVAVAGARLRYADAAVARPVELKIDSLDLAAQGSGALRGQARGWLNGERATLSVLGGSLAELLNRQAMPLQAELALARSRLRIAAVLPAPGSADETALSFDFQAAQAGDLARWLAVAPASTLPVALRGRARIADGAWHLEATTLKLGRSELAIDAHHTWVAGAAVTAASLSSPLLDVPELLSLRVLAGAKPGIDTRTGPGKRIDAPMAVGAADLPNAELKLDLKRVLLGRTDLTDLSMVAQTRDGRVLASPIQGRLAGAAFTASAELDLRDALPVASLELAAGEIDVGALLRGLGLAEGIDGRANTLQIKVQGRGGSASEFAAQSAVLVRLGGGHISVLGAAQRAVADIRVNEAIIAAPAGEPVQVRLDGLLDDTPVKIAISTGTLASFVQDAARLPFALSAQAAGTSLRLDGDVSLPLGRDTRLALQMSGERLDTLSELLKVELPAWGPWALTAPIRVTPSGYELQGLQVQVRQSQLRGAGRLDIVGPRPRLELQLAASHLQLDDFPWPPPSHDPPAPPALPAPPPALPQPGQGDGLRSAVVRFAGRTERLLSAKFLRRFDATVDLAADEVRSGTDLLADGTLHLELERGRLYLNPAVINLPGGTMRLSIAYDLKESEVDFAASAYVERFDYGIIARRMGRATDMRGLFSLNLALSGTAPSLDAIMRNANGSLDFAVWPTELSSGVFNLWSANLLLTLLPLIDPGSNSQVNCIVGRFDLNDGKLSHDKILIDTHQVRIRGEGQADLNSEELSFVFRPRAKGVGIFRLQTPLRVDGTLTNQRFYFAHSDVVESTLRLVASPVLWPIARLTLGPLPRDGADLCTDPLRTR